LKSIANSIARLERLIRRITDQPEPTIQSGPIDDLGRATLFYVANLGGAILSGEDSKEYAQIIDALLKAVDSEENISREEVTDYVNTSILSAIDPQKTESETTFESRVRTGMETLQSKLKGSTSPWQIHYRIYGVAPAGLPYSFGPAEFYYGDEATIGARAAQMGITDGEAIHQIEERILNRVAARVMADVIDYRAAQRLARRLMTLVTDVLNFYGNLSNDVLCQIGLVEDTAHAYGFAHEPAGNFHATSENLRPKKPFEFSKASVLPGFQRASQLLIKPNLSKLEDKLLASLQWAGRASVNSRREEAFLLFAIALEGLVLTDEKNEVTEKIATRGARLVVKPEKRRKAYDDLKDLYQIRSRIVHSGHFEVSTGELEQIGFFAKAAILIILANPDFATMSQKDLSDWFTDRSLGATRREDWC